MMNLTLSNNSKDLTAMVVLIESDSDHKKPIWLVVSQVATMVVMIVVGALANGVICHCILKHESLRTVTNNFILNLAITDFLLCVICMPFALISSILDKWIFGSLICLIEGFLLSLLCITSILTLVLIAIDRYMAIKCPLKYCSYLTNTISVYMLVVIWCYSAICSVLPAMGWGTGYVYIHEENICRPNFETPAKDNGFTTFLFAAAFAIPFVVLFNIYFSILWTARKQFRRVHSIKRSTLQIPPYVGYRKSVPKLNTRVFEIDNTCTEITSACTNTSTLMNYESKNNIRVRKLDKTKTRGFKVLLLIVAVFILCWAPHFVMIFYTCITNTRFPLVVKVLTTWTTFLNSTLNPFLYGFLNAKFRSNLKRFWGEKVLCLGWCKGTEDSRVFHINR